MLLAADRNNKETSDLMQERQTPAEGQRLSPAQQGLCDEW